MLSPSQKEKKKGWCLMFKLKSRELGLLYIEKNRRLALLEAASKVVSTEVNVYLHMLY